MTGRTSHSPTSDRIPIVPLALGLGGLIPFWTLALAQCAGVAAPTGLPSVPMALATYAALILSFLGGIRWGLAVAAAAPPHQYVVSVVPQLAAWMLLAAPALWRELGLGTLLILWGPLDARLATTGMAPRWLSRLRILLSSGAGVALFFAAAKPG